MSGKAPLIGNTQRLGNPLPGPVIIVDKFLKELLRPLITERQQWSLCRNVLQQPRR